jgi:hypothetical protein
MEAPIFSPRAHALWFMVVLLTIHPKAGADSREYPLGGPLQVRNLSPFSLLRMDFMPPPAAARLKPGWNVEARFTHANIYALSANAMAFLQQRDRRAPLSERDVQGLLATPRDIYYFDGSITSLDLVARYVLNKHWTSYVDLPLLYYSGGFSDSAIEGFHNTFRYGTAGRELVAQDQYQVLIRSGDDSLALLDAPPGVQIGDPVLGLRYALEFAPKGFAILEGAVKVPVGDEDNYVSSGALDYGVQLSLQKQLGRHGVYASLSDVQIGEADRFPSGLKDQVTEAMVAYEFGFTPHTTAILQASWSRTVFKQGNIGLSPTEHLASLGVRHRRGNVTYDFALTENFGNYDNTPDIAVTFGASWLLSGVFTD